MALVVFIWLDKSAAVVMTPPMFPPDPNELGPLETTTTSDRPFVILFLLLLFVSVVWFELGMVLVMKTRASLIGGLVD